MCDSSPWLLLAHVAFLLAALAKSLVAWPCVLPDLASHITMSWVVGMGLMCMGNERTAGSLPPRGQRGVWHKIRPRPNRAKPCLQRRESSVRFILCFILMDASLAMKLISAVIYFKSIYWAPIVSGRSPRGGNGNPREVFLPGKSPRQRSLVGYSPWGGKESDVTELTNVCWALCLEL